ncbi:MULTISPECIES: hypothetical protein [Arcobacter]|uniref:Uncharacterized protein n=2 Tax=Arcobacter TaxID=28196 RepID=A0AAE7B2Z0_9BACT|nr:MULTISPECIES: hypothetical protein [Arcobacter]MCB9096766.1 hypothetical protein [Arcobacter sp.]QKE26623.1 hypothetical protein AAQM_1887 [Arcobacter aquimarinus]QKF90430.1 hypothetical protein ACLO_1949 [Arcobacter cloacae]RXI36555.1 hypothetical protein CP986_01610 [Arcobacter aquimarinus]RXI37346.1 hypothetical protein CP963_12975 [Arcobacter cloacae]
MKKVVIKPKNSGRFSLHCPFTNEILDNESISFEIYEGAGNYIFSMCEDCMFFDAGNNAEIEKYWRDSAIEAVEKFVLNHKDENILVIEVLYKDETYLYGFLNEENIELSDEEIEKRFIKEIR